MLSRALSLVFHLITEFTKRAPTVPFSGKTDITHKQKGTLDEWNACTKVPKSGVTNMISQPRDVEIGVEEGRQFLGSLPVFQRLALEYLIHRSEHAKGVRFFESWDQAYQDISDHTRHIPIVEVKEGIKALREKRIVDVRKKSSSGLVLVCFVVDWKHLQFAIRQERSNRPREKLDHGYPVNPHTSTRH